jgi:hypothetical protein
MLNSDFRIEIQASHGSDMAQAIKCDSQDLTLHAVLSDGDTTVR